MRKANEPQPGQKFVALLHEVAAFIDFPQKQADGNVFSDIALDARKFAADFVDPYEATHFGEDGSEARGGFKRRVVLQFVFGERAVAPRLAADKTK